MPYNPRAVANYFLRRGRRDGIPIDAMKLQKLVYFAHGWHLAVRGEPLIDEPVEAWQYGPVISTIYHDFKIFGSRPIRDLAFEFEGSEVVNPEVPENDEQTREVLDRVWKGYRKFSGIELSKMTHKSGSPWDEAWKNRGSKRRGIDIPDEAIHDYFHALGWSSPSPDS